MEPPTGGERRQGPITSTYIKPRGGGGGSINTHTKMRRACLFVVCLGWSWAEATSWTEHVCYTGPLDGGWLEIDCDNRGLSGQLLELESVTGSFIHLRLEDNMFTGPLPANLGGMTKLTQLYLGTNQLTGTIPSEWGKLTKLTRVSIDNNDLKGPIPPEWGKLTKLTHVSLENNKLTGPIPSEWGKLTKLVKLDLGNNQLTGNIPQEIGSLDGLNTFEVNNNDLSGTISNELMKVGSSKLDLSHNPQLTGCAPSLNKQARHILIEGTGITGACAFECPKGTFATFTEGQDSPLWEDVRQELGETCYRCTWGFYNDVEGVETSAGCKQCPEGKSSWGGPKENAWGEEKGGSMAALRDSIDACVYCPAGQYRYYIPSTKSYAECKRCSPGFYRVGPGHNDAGCLACASDQDCSQEGTSVGPTAAPSLPPTSPTETPTASPTEMCGCVTDGRALDGTWITEDGACERHLEHDPDAHTWCTLCT